MYVERHLRRLEAPTPPALPIASLIDDDAVDPGAEGGLPAEPIEHPEDGQEHVLRQVQGLLLVAKEMDGQLVHHALVALDQIGARRLVAGETPRDEGCLGVTDARPIERDRLHRKFPCHPAVTS